MERRQLHQQWWIVIVGCAVALSATACKGGGGSPASSGFKHEQTADNLQALFAEITKANQAGDVSRAAALTRDVLPDLDRLKKALRDDADPALIQRIGGFYDSLPKGDDVAKLFQTDPARTEVQVHGATTEEIAEYADGSVPYMEFPGGARKLAESVLRPGVTFYEVELLEPGKDAGMKYHLFFFDGERWCMLGPLWRALD